MTTVHAIRFCQASSIAAALALGGCGAILPSTTGSLFGGAAAPVAAAQPTNDPTARALQVGSTAARAQKCGFNFDAVKLRTQFLAAEATSTVNAADTDKLGQVYDTAYRGIGRAVADQNEAYCTPAKTTKIKTALNRHLAGDYAPEPPEPVEQEEGIFSGFSSGSSAPPPNAPGLRELTELVHAAHAGAPFSRKLSRARAATSVA